jgi:hypothetical protein
MKNLSDVCAKDDTLWGLVKYHFRKRKYGESYAILASAIDCGALIPMNVSYGWYPYLDCHMRDAPNMSILIYKKNAFSILDRSAKYSTQVERALKNSEGRRMAGYDIVLDGLPYSSVEHPSQYDDIPNLEALYYYGVDVMEARKAREKEKKQILNVQQATGILCNAIKHNKFENEQ